MVCLGLAAITIFVNPKITKNKEYYTKKIVVIIQRLGFFVSSGDREFESRPVQRGPSTMPVNSSALQAKKFSLQQQITEGRFLPTKAVKA